MAIRSIEQLKKWFSKGSYPKETEFADWMESYYHKEEDELPIHKVEGLTDELNNKLTRKEGEDLEIRIEETEEHLEIHDNEFERVDQRIDDIRIGGTNLLAGSYDGLGWKNEPADLSLTVEKGVFISVNQTAKAMFIRTTSVPFVKGKEYTLSFYHKNEGVPERVESPFYITTSSIGSDEDGRIRQVFPNSDEWEKVEYTFTPRDEWEDEEMHIRFFNTGTKDDSFTLYLKDIKLEEGNMATTYDLSVEDIYGKFDDYLPLAGGTLSGDIALGYNKLNFTKLNTDSGISYKSTKGVLLEGAIDGSNNDVTIQSKNGGNIHLDAAGKAYYNEHEIATLKDIEFLETDGEGEKYLSDDGTYKILNNNGFTIQSEEPEDKTLIWVDESGATLPEYTNEDLVGLYEAVRELTAYCSKVVKFGFEKVMSPGNFTNNAVNDMKTDVDATPPAGMPELLNVAATQAEEEAGDEWDPEYPEWAEDFLPNLKHITIKAGKKTDLEDNFSDFVDNELLWAKDTRQLYIKNNGQPVLLNGGSTGGGSIDYDALDKLDTIGFVSAKGHTYRVRVNNNGELVVYRKELDSNQTEPTGAQTDPNTGWEYTTTLYLPKLYINSLYCGGINQDEYSYNPCSHNFVELSNLTGSDLSLQGLSLQYCGEGTQWEVLPLHGEIKSGSTFLIRGAQCSFMDINTTRIKVETYDMEWYASDGKLIRFDNSKGKFFLTWGTSRSAIANPYNNTTDTIRVSKGYIDLVGLQIENAGDADKIDASEGSPFPYMSNKYLFTKYYTMDPVSQATKALTARNNVNDWYFINLEADIIPNVEAYTPKASFQNKDLFYNKSRLTDEKPWLITVAFGIQATAPNATRCFNWTSKGYYDEYVCWRKKGEMDWIQTESFKDETGVRKYYNRIRMVATDGTGFTTHKAIVKNLSAGSYEYYIGRKKDERYRSDVYDFEVKDGADVINDGYRFVQVSDQQGFNRDEYEVWKISAHYIRENEGELDFMINTGDMTQNGNRINEWIDYDNGRLPLANLPQMITVGNNDLTPANVYVLGDGGDNSKINATNVQFFYTYEIDETNPPVFTIDGNEIFIESLYSFNYGNAHFLCVNSEISAETETMVYGLSKGQQIYDYIKKWCEADMAKVDETMKWKIAYCHEMPFTIITQDLINSFYWQGSEYSSVERSGSRLNFNTSAANRYWFSRFLQDYGFRLVLGGHKHTYTCSYPLKENVSRNAIQSMKPVIQVTPAMLQKDFNCTTLYTEASGSLAGQSFPATWQNDQAFDIQKHLCTFELVDAITAPVYLMSQATGYKHTSNKELPSPNTPWLRYFFPAEVESTSQTNVTSKVNIGQRYPFYIMFTVSEDQIVAEVKKIDNVFSSAGKYNVNISSSPQPPVAIPGNGETNSGKDLIIIE